MEADYEVVIVGGSYAGLSAAMALGRAMRRTLIIDSGKRANRCAEQAHNILSHDGDSPAHIIEKAKKELCAYDTLEFKLGKVIKAEKVEDTFILETEDGQEFNAKKLLLSFGVIDVIPEIEGFEKCWGKTILHCPYCHGYEVRGIKTALLANGELGYITAMVLSNWNKQVSFLTNGKSKLSEEHTEKLKDHDFDIIEKKVKSIWHRKGKMECIEFEDGSSMPIPVMYAKLPFVLHSDLAQQLGCKITDDGYVQADVEQKTTVSGVYAAGDCTTKGRAITIAMAAGTVAGMFINGELTAERF